MVTGRRQVVRSQAARIKMAAIVAQIGRSLIAGPCRSRGGRTRQPLSHDRASIPMWASGTHQQKLRLSQASRLEMGISMSYRALCLLKSLAHCPAERLLLGGGVFPHTRARSEQSRRHVRLITGCQSRQ